jgi:hypothetical protein
MAIAVYRPNVEAVFHAGEPEEDQFMKKPQLGRFAISTKNGIASWQTGQVLNALKTMRTL